jgi:hypothetical protein
VRGRQSLVDKLFDKDIYSAIADLLDSRGSAQRGRSRTLFTALRVAELVHRYALRPRYDRPRNRGMLIKQEAAAIMKWGHCTGYNESWHMLYFVS